MKDRKPLFIIISPGFARDEEDSTCLPAQQTLIKAINSNHPELQIIILALQYPFHQSTYEWKGNTVISFGAWKKNVLVKFFSWISVWRTLKRLKQQHTVTGILSFWCTQGALIGSYFAKQNNLIHYSWILGQDAKKENKYVKWIRPKPQQLIALSNFAATEFYKNHHILPSAIIPFGIDTSLYQKRIFNRDIDILGAGSLIALKQYDVFVNVIAGLKKKIPNIQAVICGKGPEETRLKELILKQKLQNNIIIIGEKPHAEVLEMMQHAKILLHPSAFEGFGMVCTEALYAGAHVISFCKPMNDTILHWHIQKNENEMIQKATELLQNKHLEHAPIMPYSVNDCVKKILHLYNYHAMPVLKINTVIHASN